MRKFEVTITKTTCERYSILAHNEQEAQEIAIFGDLEPCFIEYPVPIVDTEEYDESPCPILRHWRVLIGP